MDSYRQLREANTCLSWLECCALILHPVDVMTIKLWKLTLKCEKNKKCRIAVLPYICDVLRETGLETKESPVAVYFERVVNGLI